MTYNIRSDAIRRQIPVILSEPNSNVCSLIIYELFTNQGKCQNDDLENEGQGQ